MFPQTYLPKSWFPYPYFPPRGVPPVSVIFSVHMELSYESGQEGIEGTYQETALMEEGYTGEIETDLSYPSDVGLDESYPSNPDLI